MLAPLSFCLSEGLQTLEDMTMSTNYVFHDGVRHPIKTWTKGLTVEDSAMSQLRNISALPFIHSHVAAMPDVHWGLGATIGSVIATKGAGKPHRDVLH